MNLSNDDEGHSKAISRSLERGNLEQIIAFLEL